MSTILIIDDNKDYSANLVELFNLEGYTTLEAENGLLGLQTIYKHSPNLILCDMEMPIMNGIEVLQTIKATPQFSTIPFIISSGRNDEQTVKLAQTLGVATYLTKTIAVAELLTTIAHFLSKQAV